MSVTVTAWIVVGICVIAANLPFLFERVLFVWLHPSGRKGSGWQFLELLVLYFVVGGFALLLEKGAYGGIYPQSWQFYVATLCLFFVFAFPGFIYCHLWRGNRRHAVEAPHRQG
ncbi:MAG: DUF2818 family protein [Betaproteobacteria bacterium]|nr:DUF2818 family protein [Betaproteobacteria bacterium]